LNDEQGPRTGEQAAGTSERTAPARERSRPVEHARRRRLAEAFGDPLPESTRDERGGWGERPQTDGRREDDWFRDQVPPHHG